MPDKLTINCGTGVATTAPMTGPEVAAANAAAANAAAADAAAADAAVVNAIVAAAEGNRTTIEGRATAALALNDTFLALASPTAAQVRDQTVLLTRECSAVIRLLLRRLDSTTGT